MPEVGDERLPRRLGGRDHAAAVEIAVDGRHPVQLRIIGGVPPGAVQRAMTSMHELGVGEPTAGGLVAGAVAGEVLEHEHEVAGLEVDLGARSTRGRPLQPIGELAEEADLALVHVERHRHGPVGDGRGGALDDDRRDRTGRGLVLQLRVGDDAEHPGALTDRLGPEAGRRCAYSSMAPALAELRRQPRRCDLGGLRRERRRAHWCTIDSCTSLTEANSAVHQ